MGSFLGGVHAILAKPRTSAIAPRGTAIGERQSTRARGTAIGERQSTRPRGTAIGERRFTLAVARTRDGTAQRATPRKPGTDRL